ncbi:hypothetical protein RclHR1_20430003 [Rhizophagus clarus]|uniref:IS630 family transposase n=1 Tax=Rhizophagus clarus TaxID=94130 RepID=A0A2Z6RJY3_9GLOM|nr:hypothetical protein RclHR1_20430003 [Rhizophagus clarus]GES98268.1 IS630 family transposase [Rhizophagus clarus]
MKKLATVWTACIEQPVSAITIRRNLKKVGLTAYIPCKKPALSKAYRQARLEWAHAYENWGARKWRHVLFLMKALLHSFNKDVRGRLGPIILLKGSVTGQIHAKTIKDYVVPTLQIHFPRGNGIFQEDNAPPHCSKVAATTCENAGIVVLDWPVQSPDLNPIKNLWAEMKIMVRCHISPPSNIKVLEKYVKDAWKDIPSEYYKKLVNSMSKRIEAVITANGNRINY